MPTGVIPVLEVRPARVERYEHYVSEAAADAASKEGGTFIVGVKEREVLACPAEPQRCMDGCAASPGEC